MIAGVTAERSATKKRLCRPVGRLRYRHGRPVDESGDDVEAIWATEIMIHHRWFTIGGQMDVGRTEPRPARICSQRSENGRQNGTKALRQKRTAFKKIGSLLLANDGLHAGLHGFKALPQADFQYSPLRFRETSREIRVGGRMTGFQPLVTENNPWPEFRSWIRARIFLDLSAEIRQRSSGPGFEARRMAIVF